MSIWIYENKKWVVFWFGLLLIVSLSFGVGYLVAKQANPTPIIIEKCSDATN
ncbi:hypothetical protein HY967_00490 [Candidatus Jorgensenbacteria bacterium]|nr:hypothetical protein [Candidatus Jorgensenbacteria bacterium]